MHEDPTKCVCQGKGVFYQQKPLDFKPKYWVDPYPEVPMAQAEKVNCKYHHPDSTYYQIMKKKWMNDAMKEAEYKYWTTHVYDHTKKPYIKLDLNFDPAGTKSNMTPEGETMWYLSEKLEPEANIDYPDGWMEEDLILWCKDQGVPLPKYLKPKHTKNSFDIKYPGYGTIVGKVLWSGTMEVKNPKFHTQVTNWSDEPDVLIVSPNTKKKLEAKFGKTKSPAKLANLPDGNKFPYWVPNPKDTTYTVYLNASTTKIMTKEELEDFKNLMNSVASAFKAGDKK